ncbi:hypothetical protein COB72_04290 [bacterium]|nr:MAG: hypothetical protein COB72_04290 [bacterium]
MQLGPSEIIKPPADQPALVEQADVQASDTTGNADTGTIQANEGVAIQRIFNRLQSGDSQLPNALLIGGVLLMLIILMRKLRKNHKANAKRSNKQLSPSKRIANIHAQANATMDPAYRVMVDAEEMARRLGATLDNKAARLELLIEEADRKLAILNRSLANPVQSALEDHSAPIQPSRTIDPSLLDRARMEQDLEERQTRVAGRIEPNYPQPSPAPEPVIEEPISIQSQVIELAASGLSNIEIAHQLKQPIGQVELILNLRKQQG